MTRESSDTHPHTQLRANNLAQILQQLSLFGSLSRSQLAEQTALNRSTVSSLTEELLDMELIRETGKQSSRGGRPGRMLELNPKAGLVIGCEFGIDFILTIVIDFCGEMLWRRKTELGQDLSLKQLLGRLLVQIDEAILFARESQQRIFGIGLSITGMVDVKRGVMVFSPNLRWREIPIRDIVQKHTHLPIFVENDSNAAALGEHFFGVAQNVQDFLFILADVGVGGGLFLHGELYRGKNGFAGEIGHINLKVSNRPCRCGKRGCWEMDVNKASILERVRTLLEIGRPSTLTLPVTFAEVITAAEQNDPVAKEAFAETGKLLGQGFAYLIEIFDPALIVFGGSLSNAGAFLLPGILETVQAETIPVIYKEKTILLSKFGPDAPVIGAATIVIHSILSEPKRIANL